MTTQLRDVLNAIADQSPPITVVPGLFDSARRARIKRRLATAAAALYVVALSSFLAWSPSPLPTAAAAHDHKVKMPSSVVEAPRWTADVRDAPIEKALVAFAGPESAAITLVGPSNMYRIFEPSDATGTWRDSFALSPDGTQLTWATGTGAGILEVSTGEVRSLDAGLPLAWSPDSREVVLARGSEIRVVNAKSGSVKWEISLVPDPGLAGLHAALSPNGYLLAVEQNKSVTVYRREAGVVWQRLTDGVLAGPSAFTLDGERVAIFNGDYCLLLAADGTEGACAGVPKAISELKERPASQSWGEVLNWIPTLEDGRYIPTIAVGADVLKVATPHLAFRGLPESRVRFADGGCWCSEQPGPPDPGPAAARYRPVINGVAIGIGVSIPASILFGALLRLRRRRVAHR